MAFGFMSLVPPPRWELAGFVGGGWKYDPSLPIDAFTQNQHKKHKEQTECLMLS
jgi:hypothetical protein